MDLAEEGCGEPGTVVSGIERLFRCGNEGDGTRRFRVEAGATAEELAEERRRQLRRGTDGLLHDPFVSHRDAVEVLLDEPIDGIGLAQVDSMRFCMSYPPGVPGSTCPVSMISNHRSIA